LGSDGFLDILSFRIFYRSFGEPKKGTLVGLAGGPGAELVFLNPLIDLTKYGYRVVLYDQLGCGKSDMPKNRTLFTVERYVNELEEMRRTLELGKIHLMGWSWGGQLAFSYALHHQKNLRSIITTGGLASSQFALKEIQRLKSKLPTETLAIMKKYEELDDYDNPEYKKVEPEFYNRHFNRSPSARQELKAAREEYAKEGAKFGSLLYETMWGKNEFTCLGTLAYWDISERLQEISVPCSVTCGSYDEVTPTVTQDLNRRSPNSKIFIFENTAHLAFWDALSKYKRVLEILKQFGLAD
jgi:proline iminopeptidase